MLAFRAKLYDPLSVKSSADLNQWNDAGMSVS